MLSVLFVFPLLLLVWFLYSRSLVGGSSGQSEFLSVAGLALVGLMVEIVMNIMGLIGAYKKNTNFLRMYMNYSFVSTVVFTIVCILIIVSHLNTNLTKSNNDPFRSHFLVWYVVVGLISAILQTSTLLMLKTKIYRVKYATDVKATPAIDIDSESYDSDDDDHATDSKDPSHHGADSNSWNCNGWASLLDVIQNESDKSV